MKTPPESDKVDVSVSLNYSTSTSVRPRSIELEDYVIQVRAEIIGTHFTTDQGSSKEVNLGELSLYLIRVGNAVNQGVRLHDVFDVTQETMDTGNAIFDSNFRDYNRTVQKLFADPCSSDDVLLLHRLEIKPFARGQKLGQAVLIRAIEDWSSGCSLVVMKPFPLQFEVEARKSKRWVPLALEGFPQNEKQAFKQLRGYYEQLGFKKIGRSDFYALCLHSKWTALDELELPDEFQVPADKFTSSD